MALKTLKRDDNADVFPYWLSCDRWQCKEDATVLFYDDNLYIAWSASALHEGYLAFATTATARCDQHATDIEGIKRDLYIDYRAKESAT